MALALRQAGGRSWKDGGEETVGGGSVRKLLLEAGENQCMVCSMGKINLMHACNHFKDRKRSNGLMLLVKDVSKQNVKSDHWFLVTVLVVVV